MEEYRETVTIPHSRIRVRSLTLPFANVLPAARRASVAFLIIALAAGAYRFITGPFFASAIEFTEHIVGAEGGAVGVLGVALSDLDDDGDIDIVTAGSDDIKVYFQKSDKTFEQKIVQAVDGERVQVIDLDLDGAKDLLVTLKNTSPSVRWYRNNGNLEFSGTNIGTGTDGKAYAGDIDGDGAPDIVTATTQGGLVVLQRWMNNGSGSFAATTLNSDSGVTAITIGDINGNGYRDIVTGGRDGLQNWDTSNGFTWNRNDIDDGHGNKTSIAIADVNGDGRSDIVTGDQPDDKVVVHRHIDHSTFDRIELPDATDAATVVPVDLDEDGDEDIVVAGQDDNSVYWFENNGVESFTRHTIADELQSVFGLAVGDIDNDNDFDIAASNHFGGTVYWYERARAKPVATAPNTIQQTNDGAGRILFDTTISDVDFDPSSIRVQYSKDGEHWYKPWILEVRPAQGSVDLKNSNGFQIGTSNAVDTDDFESVKLTIIWDTKSANNTGGPITGDIGTVYLRVIPRDASGWGAAAVSNAFRIDNGAPTSLGSLQITSISDTAASFSWNVPTDSSPTSYQLYYGIDSAAVLEKRSDVIETSTNTATVSNLVPDTTYTFKLFATDSFGNSAASPSVRGTTSAGTSAPPTSQEAPPINEGFSTPAPTLEQVPTSPFEESPIPIPTEQIFFEPAPTPATPPTTTFGNLAPRADAGPDQIVNATALVVLDGTASTDPEGDSLSFSWKQLSGPLVGIVSERTANPTFIAGNEREAYVFLLTVRDSKGASATDILTVATQQLPIVTAAPVVTTSQTPLPTIQETPGADMLPEEETTPSPLFAIAGILNGVLFIAALLAILLSAAEHLVRRLGRGSATAGVSAFAAQSSDMSQRGAVVHYKTGRPLPGVQIMIYDASGKLKRTEKTNEKGEFPTLIPIGSYTIRVRAAGFTFAPPGSSTIKLQSGIIYSGGTFDVTDAKSPLTIVIPMKPEAEEPGTLRSTLLRAWQIIQRAGRAASWPILVIGALTNTALVFFAPAATYLILEVLYVMLVIVKVVLEVRMRPAFGLVRDAISHKPIGLAVVRLFEESTNRLVMTRVTDAQGKFFALPSPGIYTVSISKPGYGTFTRQHVEITAEQDSILQMTGDLMPAAPNVGTLAQARAATL